MQTVNDELGRETTTIGDDVFRISNTGFGSARYGDCEICHKFCSTTFLQSHLKTTGRHISTTFGHKECLEQIRSKKVA